MAAIEISLSPPLRVFLSGLAESVASYTGFSHSHARVRL
jgi:hypothetical protein